jgi:hypothetical protein
MAETVSLRRNFVADRARFPFEVALLIGAFFLLGETFRLDSKAADPIVKELYYLWVSGKEARLGSRRVLTCLFEKFGKKLSRYQIYRLRRQFENGSVWVDGEGRVHRKPKGIVARQSEFARKFYMFNMKPDRELFREAIKRIQRGDRVSKVMRGIISGELPKLVSERIIRGLKGYEDASGDRNIHPQNMLIGHASAEARRILCVKYRIIGRVPMNEHRKLTGEIMKKWYRELSAWKPS